MYEMAPIGIGLVIAFVVLSLTLHEAAHAWVADRRGDPTARELGRVTLNPLPHIDLFMTILVPLMLYLMRAPVFGGAKPVPVNYHRLKNPLSDMTLVALAGPFTNLVLAAVFLLAWKAAVYTGGYEANMLLPKVLYASSWVNVVLAIFNLFPIPPLDGSRVMAWLLPSSLREAYVSLERFGLLIVLVVIYVLGDYFLPILREAIDNTLQALHVLTGGVW
jgi:Zn-dependent protease